MCPRRFHQLVVQIDLQPSDDHSISTRAQTVDISSATGSPVVDWWRIWKLIQPDSKSMAKANWKGKYVSIARSSGGSGSELAFSSGCGHPCYRCSCRLAWRQLVIMRWPTLLNLLLCKIGRSVPMAFMMPKCVTPYWKRKEVGQSSHPEKTPPCGKNAIPAMRSRRVSWNSENRPALAICVQKPRRQCTAH